MATDLTVCAVAQKVDLPVDLSAANLKLLEHNVTSNLGVKHTI